MLVPMFSQPYESVTPMSLVYDFRAYVEDIFNVDDLVEIVNFIEEYEPYIVGSIRDGFIESHGGNLTWPDGTPFAVQDFSQEYNMLVWDHLDFVVKFKMRMGQIMDEIFPDWPTPIVANMSIETLNKERNSSFRQSCMPHPFSFFTGCIPVVADRSSISIHDPFNGPSYEIRDEIGQLVMWPDHLRTDVVFNPQRAPTRVSLSIDLKCVTCEEDAKLYENWVEIKA